MVPVSQLMVICCLLAFSTAGGRINLTATPQEFNPLTTRKVALNCTFECKKGHVLSVQLSKVIKKGADAGKPNDLVSLNTNSKLHILYTSSNVKYSGKIQGMRKAYLAVKWKMAPKGLGGIYQCKVNVMDSVGRAKRFRSQIRVQEKKSTFVHAITAIKELQAFEQRYYNELEKSEQRYRKDLQKSEQRCRKDLQKSEQRYRKDLKKSEQRYRKDLQKSEQRYRKDLKKSEQRCRKDLQKSEQRYRKDLEKSEQRCHKDLQKSEQRYRKDLQKSEQRYRKDLQKSEQRCRKDLQKSEQRYREILSQLTSIKKLQVSEQGYRQDLSRKMTDMMKWKVSMKNNFVNLQQASMNPYFTPVHRGRYYAVYKNKAGTGSFAEGFCRRIGPGYLAEINDWDEWYFVAKFLRRIGHINYYFISGRKNRSNGRFYWPRKGKWTSAYFNWDRSQPNNVDGNQNCVAMDREYAYRVSDIKCFRGPQGFICEIPK